MVRNRFILFVYILCAALGMPAFADQWETHFAYNNVTQIALSSDKVFALSDGSLFSVDKQTEQIKKYDRQSGLHGTNILCVHYDAQGSQLIVAYANGKIDLLSASGVHYISDLYNKDMTQRKDIYNITLCGRTAYLSTHYGVQTMDLRENKLVDSYWLRPGGQETPIEDVLLTADSIYAFASDSMYCAALTDRLVDYTYWKREGRSGRITPDATKGKQYTENNTTWIADGANGVTRISPIETVHYKPAGPLMNVPYRITATRGGVWVVPGKSGPVQGKIPAVLMHYNGSQWVNIPTDVLVNKIGQLALDFVNVAVDPRDINHYYVTSYGTGLYEFDHDTLVRHDIAGGENLLGAAAANDPQCYTRLDCAVYDEDNNLWLVDAGAGSVVYQIVGIDSTGQWRGLMLQEGGEPIPVHTPAGLVIDHTQPNYKWVAVAREITFGVYLLDDNGTRFDISDDRTVHYAKWTNQFGQTFAPLNINTMIQDQQGRIWIGTDMGAAYIETGSGYFTSDAIVQPDVTDQNGENPITSLIIKAICQTPNGDIWIGTSNLGIYVLNSSATEIIAQYTTENSAMPGNGILSMACDESGVVWIGTEDGLVSVDPSTTSLKGDAAEQDETDEGNMLQWRLHLSYKDAVEAAATPQHVYAVAHGALFSFDRSDETLNYWSRATGLNSTGIAHIAYDEASGYLVVVYDNGRIDLIDDEGDIRQMPDLYMKAGSMAVTANSITVGSRHTYLAMPFGIVAILPKKGEVSDTYYIGPEAASVNVLRVLEKGDSLYAFTADQIYSAALNDNLVDYSFWHASPIPVTRLQDAALYKDAIYTLQHDSLYRLEGHTWHLAVNQPVDWMHVSGGQLLYCVDQHTLYRLTDEGSQGLSNLYNIHDAIYSQGEYWLCEANYGLIRLGREGDDYYHTNGPNSNSGYFLCTAHGQLYSVIGGRWAVEKNNPADLNIYTGTDWINRDYMHVVDKLGVLTTDPVSVAVDPDDPGHFFVANYGNGVVEYRNYEAVKQYTYNNSTLQPVNTSVDERFYTRTDGAMIDDANNLWVLNATEIGQPVHVKTPQGGWFPLTLRSGGSEIFFSTPAGIWVDNRNTHHKWMMDQRNTQKIILLDDGGTPTDNRDDKCMARSTFVDQNGNTLTPTAFRSFAQDRKNRIWIGTDKGVLLIPATVNFLTSNSCQRIIIPRNDGSGLGDYLLGEEQINCMAVDGGNRMWIGTANSGLYLIEDDTITVAHFTEDNSLLPSNTIQSVAIEPQTGMVYVGTDKGIASYLSDASEPAKNFSDAYAYPNPVRPDYTGVITICGLKENTTVNIIDSGGNLVCKTRSNGGTAVWDGKIPGGRRATPGVYTALCNAKKGHTVVKILVVR